MAQKGLVNEKAGARWESYTQVLVVCGGYPVFFTAVAHLTDVRLARRLVLRLKLTESTKPGTSLQENIGGVLLLVVLVG
jgi:hypothetical protein